MKQHRLPSRFLGLLLGAQCLAQGLAGTPEAASPAPAEGASLPVRDAAIAGQLDDAIKAASEAVRQAEQAPGPDRSQLRECLQGLGELLLKARRYGPAREVFERLWGLQASALGETSVEVGETLATLGRAAYLQGAASDALPVLKRSAEIKFQALVQGLKGAGPEQRRPLLEAHRHFLALYLTVLTALDSPEAAHALLASSLQEKGLLLRLARDARETAASEASPDASNAPTEQPSSDSSEVLSPDSSPDSSPDYSETSAQPLTLAERLELRQQARKLIAESVGLERAWAERGRPLAEASPLHMRQLALNDQAVRIEKRLATQAEMRPEDVVAALLSGQVLVDFQVVPAWSEVPQSQAQLVAVVVDPSATVPLTRIKLGPVAPVAQAIRGYLAAMEQGGAQRSVDALAQSLYQQVWAPLGPSVINARTTYVVTDGLLQLLPFSALMDEKGAYVQGHLEQLTSARDVIEADKEGPEEVGWPLVMVAPRYSLSDATGKQKPGGKQGKTAQVAAKTRSVGTKLSDLYFAELPGTVEEGRVIRAIMHTWRAIPQLLQGEEATEQSLRAAINPRYLHIATHGFFLDPGGTVGGQNGAGTEVAARGVWAIRPTAAVTPVSPEAETVTPDILRRAGLALAGANAVGRGGSSSESQDGILSAEEAVALHLAGTELVVLSACQTALGGVSDGEGIYGMQRAFQEAGAHSVMATLWSVNDAATEKFMTIFYAQIFDGGQAPQWALERTRQKFLEEYPEWRHPYYWAGFQLVGRSSRIEGGPIPDPSSQHMQGLPKLK